MVTFRIPDMTCGRCAGTIARAVAAVDGTARLEFDLARNRVAVTSSAAEAELREAIRDAGYTAELDEAAPGTRPAGSPACCCGGRKAAALDGHQAGGAAAGPCCE